MRWAPEGGHGEPRPPGPPGVVTAALRASAGPALAAVTRRIGDFDDAEDAVQEAMIAAITQWPRDGLPEHPTAWLVRVAVRRAVDTVRSDVARRGRERRVNALESVDAAPRQIDDTHALYLLCCHPGLSRPMQVALTLRAVGGLTIREIARGLLQSESTTAQQISRAKATLRRIDAQFAMPQAVEMPERMAAVVEVLGVIHTEAHTAAQGDDISRPALGADALRIARQLLRHTATDAPWRGELTGLVALMLLTEARAPARMTPDGALRTLAEQDRSLWRTELIAEGQALLTETLAENPLGPIQLKAAIAAVHADAASHDSTDWLQILRLYDLLRAVDRSPVVELGRLVAYAEVESPDRALAVLDAMTPAAPEPRRSIVRAHLLARAGRDASPAYRAAAELAANGAERRWLQDRDFSASSLAPSRRAGSRSYSPES